jgi:hypothetical protein
VATLLRTSPVVESALKWQVAAYALYTSVAAQEKDRFDHFCTIERNPLLTLS